MGDGAASGDEGLKAHEESGAGEDGRGPQWSAPSVRMSLFYP